MRQSLLFPAEAHTSVVFRVREVDYKRYLGSLLIPQEIAPIRIGLHVAKLENFTQTQGKNEFSDLKAKSLI